MKYYQIVEVRTDLDGSGNEDVLFSSTNYISALSYLKSVLHDRSKKPYLDHPCSYIQGRVYDLDDSIDPYDFNSIIASLADSIGYDIFDPYDWHVVSTESSIKLLRIRAGMTQSDFALFFQIPLKTIQSWEQSQRSPASYVVDLIKFKLCVCFPDIDFSDYYIVK